VLLGCTAGSLGGGSWRGRGPGGLGGREPALLGSPQGPSGAAPRRSRRAGGARAWLEPRVPREGGAPEPGDGQMGGASLSLPSSPSPLPLSLPLTLSPLPLPLPSPLFRSLCVSPARGWLPPPLPPPPPRAPSPRQPWGQPRGGAAAAGAPRRACLAPSVPRMGTCASPRARQERRAARVPVSREGRGRCLST